MFFRFIEKDRRGSVEIEVMDTKHQGSPLVQGDLEILVILEKISRKIR